MRALITGAGGFVGDHLCSYLLAHTDWAILGTVYPNPVDAPHPHPRLHLSSLDLRNRTEVERTLVEWQPDAIFHLAALSSVPASFKAPWETLENNIRAQLNVLEAARRLSSCPRVLIVGSNEEYGKPHPDELPITEETPLRPQNPYAVSKVAQDFLGLQYHLTYGIEVVRLRPFNHTGPGQSDQFVVPAFASQIARIERGEQLPIVRVGNLNVARDFSDVRDIVRAYYLAVTQGEPGEVYNLSAGQPRSIKDILDALLSLSTVKIEVEIDPDRYRPSDTPVAYGSSAKFRARTGWEPQIPFDQTIHDVLNDWRHRPPNR
ncbi:MAG: GDP-mannose 4,6-dehydratase [Anaerolineae bacterium]|nr:GDP-mannose 4,6-dehydratase [Anaerolineae bacterium]